MVESITWPIILTASHYGARLKRDGGIDFNEDGKIEGAEKFSEVNGKKSVDADDCLRYLEANRPYVEKEIKFVSFQKGFSSNNVINQILFIQSGMFSEDEVASAYQILGAVLAQVKQELNDEMTDQEKAQLVYAVLRRQGFTLEPQAEPLLINNLLNRSIDCDTSSLIFLAVAQELGWPVTLALVPNHVFVRWQGESVFNIDYGEIRLDQYYRQAYLWNGNTLNQNGIVALAHQILAWKKEELGKGGEALANYQQVYQLAPSLLAYDYYFSGLRALRANDAHHGITFLNEAIKLDPLFLPAYDERANTYYQLGDYQAAVSDLDQILALNPKSFSTRLKRGAVNFSLGEYRSGLIDLFRGTVPKLPFVHLLFDYFGEL
ncbi:MAG: tetratricopeptide repeat protein [Candidatus Margulisbacteria bacterium]|nr:tetratricopeptide repeat protein [Candidatus Margulisiibacteriota bacterium]